MIGLELIALELASTALTAAAKKAGNVTGDHLAKQLLDLQDEQTRLVREVQGDVQRLINGPWETSRLLVEQATLSRLSSDERRDYLTRARDRLFDAIPLQPEGTVQRATVENQLSAVLAATGDGEGAALHSRRAYDQALQGVALLLAAAQRQVLIKGPIHTRLMRRGLRFDAAFNRAMPGFNMFDDTQADAAQLLLTGALPTSLRQSPNAAAIHGLHQALALLEETKAALDVYGGPAPLPELIPLLLLEPVSVWRAFEEDWDERKPVHIGRNGAMHLLCRLPNTVWSARQAKLDESIQALAGVDACTPVSGPDDIDLHSMLALRARQGAALLDDEFWSPDYTVLYFRAQITGPGIDDGASLRDAREAVGDALGVPAPLVAMVRAPAF